MPSGNWGFFKVPGFWPGNTSYIQEDSQTLHVHPSWKNADLRGLSAAWYQREITVPANWTGRRIGLSAEYVNSYAVVFVDGKVATKRQEHIAAYFEPFWREDALAGIGPAEVHNRDPCPLPLVSGGAAAVGDGVLARDGNIVFCQLVPWQFGEQKQMNLRRTFRSSSRLVTRLAANMGIGCTTPLLARFRTPVDPATAERRWLTGFYLDVPEEWDDPYRFFRW